MNGDRFVIKFQRRLGEVGDDELEGEWIIHAVVNVQTEQVNLVRPWGGRGGMNQGDRDRLGGLPFHREIGIGAAHVPRHGLAGPDLSHAARLHRSVGGQESGVGQGNVPRGRGGFA